jgi:myo-inositol 2-dehydrogenase/D-chiro-inositol 1-dehydrogenase
MESVDVGVIGAGRMGATHVRLLQRAVPDARVVALSDVVLDSAERLAAESGVPAVHADPLDLVRDPAVAAVVVASADDSHEALVLACLHAGKPVLCEKPPAPTAEASLRIVEAEVAGRRRLVQVGFMRRYDPGYVDMKRRLEAGDVGAPLLLHCAHRNPAAYSADRSEHLLVSSLVHEIDIARWLLGEEIARVTVFLPEPSRHAAAGIRDPQFAVLETAGGRLVDVEVFVNAGYGYDIRCELVGETGTLELPVEVTPGFEQRFEDAYLAELEAWTAGRRDGPTAWDGYAAAAVSGACIESLHSGRSASVDLGPPGREAAGIEAGLQAIRFYGDDRPAAAE